MITRPKRLIIEIKDCVLEDREKHPCVGGMGRWPKSCSCGWDAMITYSIESLGRELWRWILLVFGWKCDYGRTATSEL